MEAVDPGRVAGYASDLVSGLGPAVEPAAIDMLIQALRDPRPIEDAIRVLEEEWGISAERHRRVIDLIEGVRGDPLAIALRAVGLAQAAAPVAARAATTAVTVTVVWQPPSSSSSDGSPRPSTVPATSSPASWDRTTMR